MAIKKLPVLIIDDSKADALLLQAFLNQVAPGELEYTHSEDPEDALQQLGVVNFHCIFLDYLLVRTDGLDVLNRIRNSGYDLPIVACTGFSSGLPAVDEFTRQADGYLVKDELTKEVVKRELENALQKFQQGSSAAAEQKPSQDSDHLTVAGFQTSLRQITFNCEQIIAEGGDAVDDQAREKLENICATAKELQQMVAELADISSVSGLADHSH